MNSKKGWNNQRLQTKQLFTMMAQLWPKPIIVGMLQVITWSDISMIQSQIDRSSRKETEWNFLHQEFMESAIQTKVSNLWMMLSRKSADYIPPSFLIPFVWLNWVDRIFLKTSLSPLLDQTRKLISSLKPMWLKSSYWMLQTPKMKFYLISMFLLLQLSFQTTAHAITLLLKFTTKCFTLWLQTKTQSTRSTEYKQMSSMASLHLLLATLWNPFPRNFLLSTLNQI